MIYLFPDFHSWIQSSRLSQLLLIIQKAWRTSMKQHIVPSIYRFLHQQQNMLFFCKKKKLMFYWDGLKNRTVYCWRPCRGVVALCDLTNGWYPKVIRSCSLKSESSKGPYNVLYLFIYMQVTDGLATYTITGIDYLTKFSPKLDL